MPQRLTPLEVSLLALDTAHTPSHVGGVHVFAAAPGGLDYASVLALVGSRIAYVPRYRQRVLGVPGRLAGPVWADDEGFDLTYHVRQAALPRPGGPEQLREFVSRVLARRLDHSRPLWEVYVVEGLEDDRVALVTKSSLALVDGVDTVEIAQVLLDAEPDLSTQPEPDWQPLPEPTPWELVAGAVWENTQDPIQGLDNLRGALTGALGVAIAVGETVGGVGGFFGELAGDALRGRRPAPSAFGGVVSQSRRFSTVVLPLAQLQAVRTAHTYTVNDAVLAVVTGGLRLWLQTRGEPVTASSALTALVPMSVTEAEGEPTSLGSQVAPRLQSLPVGEANAVMRLHQVALHTQAHKDSGRAVDARELAEIAGFAPATLHALGVRVAAGAVRRPHDLLVTNVPGPQQPLFANGARLVASYPVLPLSSGHLLTIGATSYDGSVFVGLTADRDAVRDLDVLGQCLQDALEELLETTARGRTGRQPTRKAAAARRPSARKAAPRKRAGVETPATPTPPEEPLGAAAVD